MTAQKNVHIKVLTGCLILTLCTSIFAAPQMTAARVDGAHADSAEMILVSVETFVTEADGETRSSGSYTLSLNTGESAAAYVACGAFDRNGGIRSLFTMGGTGHLDPKSGPPFSNLPDWTPTAWGIRCSLIDWDAGDITLEVEWERIHQKKPGAAARQATGRRIITFTEQGRHLLDFIGTADGKPDPAGLVSRTVELKVLVAERPALASKKIQYDLWLVNEAANDERTSIPIRLIGRQGERLDFNFKTIHWPVPGIQLENGHGIDALMQINGTVRGRIRPDGSIGIALISGRHFGLAAAGDDSHGWSSSGKGRKHFTITPGETVSTLFPQPAGQSILHRQCDLVRPTQGVTVTETAIRVQFKPFFEGHSLSLILSAETIP